MILSMFLVSKRCIFGINIFLYENLVKMWKEMNRCSK